MCSGSSNQLLLPRMSFGAAANRALQLTSQLSPTQPFPFVPLRPLPLPPPPPAESALVVLPSSSIMQFQSQQGEAWSLLHVCSRKHCEYIILPAKLKKIIIKPVNIIAQDFTGGTTETPGVKPALLKINPQASNSEKKTKLFHSVQALEQEFHLHFEKADAVTGRWWPSPAQGSCLPSCCCSCLYVTMNNWIKNGKKSKWPTTNG